MGKEVSKQRSKQETTQRKLTIIEYFLLLALKILKRRLRKSQEKQELLTQKIKEYETN